MKTLAAAAVLPALVASACAFARAGTTSVVKPPSNLNGVYTARVFTSTLSGTLNGRWFLWLHGGTYTFNYMGKTSKNVIVSGAYVITGHHMTFRDRSMACSAEHGVFRKAGVGRLSVLRLPKGGDVLVQGLRP